MRVFPPVLSLFLVLSPATQAHNFYGYLAGEARYFFNEPLYPGQKHNSASVAAYLEYYHDYDGNDQRWAATLFARYDSADDKRRHSDIRELYWWKDYEFFQVFSGVRKVYWGVAESLHLVDVINQSDLVENIDQEDKLGQPMLEFLLEQNWGTVKAYILPYFRAKPYPGKEGRLRFAIPVIDDPLYASGAEEGHIDLALRWSHYLGAWDLGLSYFSGTNRDAQFTPVHGAGGVEGVRPFYSQIEQIGVDAQATLGSWLWKLELISVRDNEHGRHTAAVGGFEYTFYSIAETGWDLGAIAEYQFDDRSGPAWSMGQNDIAAGIRWSLNDMAGTELLALLSQDLEHSNRFVSVEARRRFTDDWELSMEARFFGKAEIGTPEYQLRDDDYLQAELRFYF